MTDQLNFVRMMKKEINQQHFLKFKVNLMISKIKKNDYIFETIKNRLNIVHNYL